MSEPNQDENPDDRSDTIYCMHCGTSARATDYACNRCGERVYVPDPSRVPPLGFTSCPQCAAANEAHASFCAVCSAEIDHNARISPGADPESSQHSRGSVNEDADGPFSERKSGGYRIGGGTFKPSQWGLPKRTRSKAEDNQIPEEIQRWNWGAFILGPIWGMMHGIWWTVLGFLPFLPLPYTLRSIGFVVLVAVMVMLGYKGNELAWRSRQWDSAEKFLKIQERWARWSVIFAIGAFVAFIIFLLGQG